ncbi:peptide ABC transporter permease, partial [Pseudoalteromonas sp. SIMBA_162]
GDPIDLMMGDGGNVSEAEEAALRSELNLDQPLHIQLKDYFFQLLQGDLGESFKKSRPVSELIAETLPATIELALAAVFVSAL